VRVVVNELVGAGESAAKFGQAPLGQRDDLGGEPRQERGKLRSGTGLASIHELRCLKRNGSTHAMDTPILAVDLGKFNSLSERY
jgi:hypothetical protein